jgi:hypothetical protein
MRALPVTLHAEALPAQIITLRNRTPNPIAKLFTDELREFSKSLTKARGRRPRTGAE